MKIQLFLIFFALLICSCSQDKVDCGPNGIYCVDCEKECFCDFYYEGELCDIEIREKFIGEWVVEDYRCNSVDHLSEGLTVVISEVTDVTKIKIVAPEAFLRDSIIAHVDFIGYLTYEESKIVGTRILRLHHFNIFYEEELDQLSVFLETNEDCDEYTEFCHLNLSRK